MLDAIDNYVPAAWMKLLRKCASTHKSTPAWQQISALSAEDARQQLMLDLQPLSTLDQALKNMRKGRLAPDRVNRLKRREVPEEASVAPDDDGNTVCMERSARLASASRRNVFEHEWQWTVCQSCNLCLVMYTAERLLMLLCCRLHFQREIGKAASSSTPTMNELMQHMRHGKICTSIKFRPGCRKTVMHMTQRRCFDAPESGASYSCKEQLAMQIVGTRRVASCVRALYVFFHCTCCMHWQVFKAVMPGVLSASRKRTCTQDCLYSIVQLLGVKDTKSHIYNETLPAEDVDTQLGVILKYATSHLGMTYVDLFGGTNGLARAKGGPESNLLKIKSGGPILVVSLSFRCTRILFAVDGGFSCTVDKSDMRA